jgi:hypothetical protein
MMDTHEFAHMERIAKLQTSLSRITWLTSHDVDRIGLALWGFDDHYWPIISALSLSLYDEMIGLIDACCERRLLDERPQVSVVIPVYQGDELLLRTALESLSLQVGVTIDCWISIDGEGSDLALVKQILSDLPGSDSLPPPKLAFSETNQGVAMCRNLVLRQISAPFFTCLDADDFFHPLRCLHAFLLLLTHAVDRVNTSYCRVCRSTGKIILINNQVSTFGHNSFLARSTLLKRYGYLANMRRHEDTEYMRRMEYFGVPMLNSLVVSHYLFTKLSPEYSSLSTDVRTATYIISDHPYLAGSITAELTEERLTAERHYGALYGEVISEAMLKAFPGE